MELSTLHTQPCALHTKSAKSCAENDRRVKPINTNDIYKPTKKLSQNFVYSEINNQNATIYWEKKNQIIF